MNAANAHYMIPKSEGRWPALALAVSMHAALFAFLWIGISWQSQTPVALEAEVWDMKAEQAAPPPVPQAEPVVEEKPLAEPPPVLKQEAAHQVDDAPPPVNPDIALEKLKKKQAAERKIEEEKKQAEAKQREDELKKQADLKKQAEQKKLDEQKKADDKKKQDLAAQNEKKRADDKVRKDKEKADAQKLSKMRADDMQRVLAAGNGSSNSTGSAAKSTGARGDPSYAALVVAKIKSNLTYGGDTGVAGNPQAVYRIHQLPNGEILSSTRVKSSGIAAYDAAVEKAIAKSSPLPRKKDGSVDREIDATFNLKEQP
jgi:colicin import membrane protein